MIAFVKGKFVQKTPAHLIVDVQGVGYELHISLNTYEAIQGKEEGLLYTYLQIKEDAHVLFGFSEPAEKELFIHLISVSGVGAATARMMLSSVKPDELIKIIVHGNTAQLEKIKGIGKKTAERIVLELKDKLAKMGPTTNISPLINNTLDQDALNALVALGIGRSAAEQAVKRVLTAEPGNSQVEDIIKKALKLI
ncbi:MAG: Holliday junction branch migration protein RuvA [Chitinophagaceae bacterium]|uniref:Holliday junction branch migration protein RuvA n=1 Tax=unclassified Paraflavitalea TaxID=2798305 RepID=UPI003D33F4E1|nr:Holliday junction branch migration protein RuvA [Chitinophagaceae bacterium]